MIAGRYTLEREIGRGGSGTVHLALDEVLGRQVAIKRIGLIPGSDNAELERAEREARLAAALNHPNVVSVFDLVDADDVRWLVMEFVDGETLSERVRSSGPLETTEAARLLGQTADALVEAHGLGIVHRDVKPSNILIAGGDAKLNDFGIARATDDPSLTQTGLVTGSPAYLAPEVASGSSATPASDVWSLGATLYHAVTGRPPYEVGDNLIGALYKIVHEDPPRLPGDHPMAGLLTVMMNRDIEARWSMPRVRDELGRIARGQLSTIRAAAPATATSAPRQDTGVLPTVQQPAPVHPPPRPGHPGARRWGLIAAAGVLAVAAVVAAYVLAGRDTPEAVTEDGPSTPRTSQATGSSTPPLSAEDTREQMDAFITSYLETVTSDPEAAFQQLTPEFREASGGFEGYMGWWGRVRSATLEEIESNPSDLTVGYTVDYVMKSGERDTQRVRLQLERFDDQLLIAGEGS
ncbi:serine/threonine protein kinase [Nocardioides eburneiflavus]|uniref:non-specific serine/threonine protein kinase n=1 Tax=Nocardioides eburneiflavus TaxID=2518372 RepID=A0A4Z1C742_9ACTN|nr:serine/threonine-protein kinase [Nocardioides eburneiflavus]TGN65242.1 serine/threonine protein kinase [Nocardioides eburneiflavus]